MYRKVKENILKLRSEGKTYPEIMKILGCGSGIVSYHCGIGQREKAIRRNNDTVQRDPVRTKTNEFKRRKVILRSNLTAKRKFAIDKVIGLRIKDYCGQRIGHSRRKYMKPYFTPEDVRNKIGDNPICYLTGEPIDLTVGKSFAFDHIIPVSRGGDNSLENLGICSRMANFSKRDMTPDEYFFLCRKVLEHQGFTVIPPKEKDQLES